MKMVNRTRLAKYINKGTRFAIMPQGVNICAIENSSWSLKIINARAFIRVNEKKMVYCLLFLILMVVSIRNTIVNTEKTGISMNTSSFEYPANIIHQVFMSLPRVSTPSRKRSHFYNFIPVSCVLALLKHYFQISSCC